MIIGDAHDQSALAPHQVVHRAPLIPMSSPAKAGDPVFQRR
jgi:hypothetical protein